MHMPMLVLDPNIQADLLQIRQASGLDKYDEVWEGVTVIMPLPNDEHQEIATSLATVFTLVFGWPNPHKIRSGVNVSDRVADWTDNFREPDVVIYLQGTTAVNYGTHWCGGPDLAVEIASPGDRPRDKLPFYASVRTREVLIVDRDPWQLELYQLQQGQLVSVGRSDTVRST